MRPYELYSRILATGIATAISGCNPTISRTEIGEGGRQDTKDVDVTLVGSLLESAADEMTVTFSNLNEEFRTHMDGVAERLQTQYEILQDAKGIYHLSKKTPKSKEALEKTFARGHLWYNMFLAQLNLKTCSNFSPELGDKPKWMWTRNETQGYEEMQKAKQMTATVDAYLKANSRYLPLKIKRNGNVSDVLFYNPDCDALHYTVPTKTEIDAVNERLENRLEEAIGMWRKSGSDKKARALVADIVKEGLYNAANGLALLRAREDINGAEVSDDSKQAADDALFFIKKRSLLLGDMLDTLNKDQIVAILKEMKKDREERAKTGIPDYVPFNTGFENQDVYHSERQVVEDYSKRKGWNKKKKRKAKKPGSNGRRNRS